MKEKEIEKICKKEGKILATKEWLCAAFFLSAVITAIVYLKSLSEALNSSLGIDGDRAAVVKIIIAFSVFAVSIIAGYLYNQLLSKKLDRLWEQKKALF
jgi:hypothetical protein